LRPKYNNPNKSDISSNNYYTSVKQDKQEK